MTYQKTKSPVYNRPKIFYDIESYKRAYTVAMIDDHNQRYLVFATEGEKPTEIANAKLLNLNQLKELTEKYQFIGFNNRHYDDYMIMSILAGKRPVTVNRLSTHLIYDDKPPFAWQIPPKSLYGTFDICSVIPRSTSLKQLESDAGLNVKESSLDFRLQRKLTATELTDTIKYNFNDVVATKAIFYTNQIYSKYLQHVNVINKYMPGADWAVSLSDASLAELIITQGKQSVPMKQKFTWQLNGHFVLDYIPVEWKTPLLEYAKGIEAGIVNYNNAVNKQEMTSREAGIKFLKSVPVPNFPELKLGEHLLFRPSLGGAHCKYIAVDGTSFVDYTDVNHRDISGAYGQLILDTKLFGSQMTKVFYQFMKDKWAAKKTGDPNKIAPTKLMTNAPSGKSDQPGSKLYNPIGMIEDRVMLQVLLYLAVQIVLKHGGEVFSVNTDGFFYLGDESKIKPDFDQLYHDWKFDLCYDHIDRYIGKDDNSRVIINGDKIEEASGEIVHQAFNPLKPSSVPRIVDRTVLTKLVHPSWKIADIVKSYAKKEKTDLFAITIKADKNHRTVFNHLIGQKVNRVFLTTDGITIGMYSLNKNKIENTRNLEPNSKVEIINQTIPPKLPNKLDLEQYIRLAQTFYEHWHTKV